MVALEIRLFGTFRLEQDRRAMRSPLSRRVKDLLCYLLLNRNMPQSREHLAGLLWGNLEERKARHCLNTALWRLQKILAEFDEGTDMYLQVDPQSIQINPQSNVWLDVAEFETRCNWASQSAESPELQAIHYRHAVSLYQGDLLIDCFEDWCLIEREHLQHRYMQSLAWLLAWHSNRKEYDSAMEYGRRLITIDPLREEVHRELIELYLAAQQPGRALRQYRTCEDAIRRELGIDPMPETQALLTRIVQTPEASRGAGVAAGGVPSTGSSRLGADLNAALAKLQEASQTFDFARTQLAFALELVEEAMRPIVSAPDPAPFSAATGPSSARSSLERATDILQEVAHHLNDVSVAGDAAVDSSRALATSPVSQHVAP